MKTAHEILLVDLICLLKDAANYHFHDFKSVTDDPCPKTALVNRLTYLRAKATGGTYDDKPDAEDSADLKQVCAEQGVTKEMMEAIFGKGNI